MCVSLVIFYVIVYICGNELVNSQYFVTFCYICSVDICSVSINSPVATKVSTNINKCKVKFQTVKLKQVNLTSTKALMKNVVR